MFFNIMIILFINFFYIYDYLLSCIFCRVGLKNMKFIILIMLNDLFKLNKFNIIRFFFWYGGF